MLTLKKICALVAIASCTTIFSSSNEGPTLDTEERTVPAITSGTCGELSTVENKRVARKCPYLIVGRTEKEDQVIVTTAACSLLALNLVNAFNSLTPVELAGGFLGGYLTADLASGILHMTLDNLDMNSGPKTLRSLSKDFQDHHLEPWRMKIDSFWFQNIELYTIGLATFASSLAMSYFGYDLTACLLTTTMGWNMLSQLAHACAHGKFKGNRVIGFLQNNGILLSTKHHNKHHTPPYNKNFCILAGHMEPVAQCIYSAAKSSVNLWKRFFG